MRRATKCKEGSEQAEMQKSIAGMSDFTCSGMPTPHSHPLHSTVPTSTLPQQQPVALDCNLCCPDQHRCDNSSYDIAPLSPPPSRRPLPRQRLRRPSSPLLPLPPPCRSSQSTTRPSTTLPSTTRPSTSASWYREDPRMARASTTTPAGGDILRLNTCNHDEGWVEDLYRTPASAATSGSASPLTPVAQGTEGSRLTARSTQAIRAAA
ncbi:hypothetical protein B0H12DRAFT_1111782 [Mycena haematopus]|nr:hypothetical protein B0H12DRAFT_1111782 [Mycena haematopus]